MIRAVRLAFVGIGTVALASFAGGPTSDPSRAESDTVESADAVNSSAPVNDERQIEVDDDAAPSPLPSELAPARLPARCGVANPPSRVINGPLVRRVVPSRYAKPFNCGPYRYEPVLADIRNLPPPRTLPGYYEGSKEILYSLPPRDRGYFVLFRW